jgi:hypothetical protein
LEKEARKECSPFVLGEKFEDAGIMTIIEMYEKELELKNALRHLTHS